MPLADFIHLRVHSAYSLSAGAIKIKELVGLCSAEAMPAVAITDSGNLFGALEFATACADAGVQPIIGCEIALAAGRRRGAAQRPRRAARARPHRAAGAERGRLSQPDGAGQPRPISTARPGAEPAIALADLAARERGADLPAGGAGGPLGRLLAEGQAEAAEASWSAR